MPHLSTLGCERENLPAAATAALTVEFPPRNAAGAPRISPTAERIARNEWHEMWAAELQFDSVERAVDYLMQGVRIAMKRLSTE